MTTKADGEHYFSSYLFPGGIAERGATQASQAANLRVGCCGHDQGLSAALPCPVSIPSPCPRRLAAPLSSQLASLRSLPLST